MTDSKKTYRFTASAYGKVLFHICKHVSKSVNGVLIGYTDVQKGEHVLMDAIPLFHTHVLTPMLKLAFIMVSATPMTRYDIL
jgi:hypothetical protein